MRWLAATGAVAACCALASRAEGKPYFVQVTSVHVGVPAPVGTTFYGDRVQVELQSESGHARTQRYVVCWTLERGPACARRALRGRFDRWYLRVRRGVGRIEHARAWISFTWYVRHRRVASARIAITR